MHLEEPLPRFRWNPTEREYHTVAIFASFRMRSCNLRESVIEILCYPYHLNTSNSRVAEWTRDYRVHVTEAFAWNDMGLSFFPWPLQPHLKLHWRQ